jgi:glycogen synthase kinase 3 beta
VIGQGAFGVVYSALSSDGTIVAIKKVKIDPLHKSRELELLRELDHPNIVHLCCAFKSGSQDVAINLVMNYLPESLHEFSVKYPKTRHYPPLLYVKLFARLRYLHANRIAHQDIKPANVLVDADSGRLRI